MTTIILNQKESEPTDEEIERLFGAKYPFWCSLRKHLRCKGPIEQVWKYYGKKNGWLLKNELEDRNIFFLVPGKNEFSLSFTFGEKAVKKIESSKLPEEVKRSVLNAKKYAEGRVLQIDIKSTVNVATACMLIDIKVQN